MKKTTVNAITFAQADDNKKVVMSNKYVAYAVYEQNKPIWEALGGVRVDAAIGLRIEFPSVKNAKAFIAQAITGMSKSEYNKARKTEPKKTAPASTKGKAKASTPAKTKGKVAVEYVSVTLADGTELQLRKSDLEGAKVVAPAKAKGNTKPTTAPNAKASKSVKTTPTKAKGNAELTDTQKKYIDICKTSILNRAASAYSIANGGEATTFKALGKSAKALEKYIPKAREGFFKSGKWTSAKKAGITEEMLG